MDHTQSRTRQALTMADGFVNNTDIEAGINKETRRSSDSQETDITRNSKTGLREILGLN